MLLLLGALHLLAAGVSASAGALAGVWLAPSAQDLLLGIALLISGGAALLRQGTVALPRRAIVAGFVLAALVLTDRAAFLTFALAAGSASPMLTAIGASVGSIAATCVALADPGAARWLPVVGRVAGAMLLLAGVITALEALRLI